jgi:hypothetical protein
MEANELRNTLRLGNLLLIDGEIQPVHSLYGWVDDNESGVNGLTSPYDSMDTEYPKIEPLQLTEEWLLKMGFIRDENGRLSFITAEHNDIFIEYEDEDMGWNIYLEDSFWIHRRFDYVHEIQNFVFALVGEELTFNI